jgi:hypothetical protein
MVGQNPQLPSGTQTPVQCCHTTYVNFVVKNKNEELLHWLLATGPAATTPRQRKRLGSLTKITVYEKQSQEEALWPVSKTRVLSKARSAGKHCMGDSTVACPLASKPGKKLLAAKADDLFRLWSQRVSCNMGTIEYCCSYE